MAQVASCPQCAHDLLVPEEMDHQSWAKCPQCRAFFQVEQAVLRELPAALPAEPQFPAAGPELAAEETTAAIMPNEPLHEAPETVSAADLADTELAQPRSTDELHAAAQRIDEWFRSAKTVADAPSIAARETAADGQLELNDDLVLDKGFERADGPANWAESQDANRRLADVEPAPEPRPTAAEAPAMAETHSAEYADALAATSAADIPVFRRRAGGKPRRQRSLMRTLAVMAVAGGVGLAGGYYVLLWLSGPRGDFLNLAQYLPAAILPAELQAQPSALAASAPPRVEEMEPVELPEELADETLAASDTAAPADGPQDSAEVQASFTTNDEPPPATLQAGEERYAQPTADIQPIQEPAPLQEPPATPLADAEVDIEPAKLDDAPRFTAEELAVSLEAANEALPALMTGNLEDGRQVAKAKGYSYSLLADLAQKATFADTSLESASTDESQQAAQELFQKVLSDAHTRGEINAILPKWIASPHRKHGGVFFAAALNAPREAGSVMEYDAALETGETIALLVPTNRAEAPDHSSRPLGIVGWLLDNPSELVTGYTGTTKQAVWAGALIPLN